MSENKPIKFFRILLFAALVTPIGCGTVPITGRSQLNLVTDQEMLNSSNASFAKFINEANSKNAILLASESESAASTIALVNRVSIRIIDAAGIRNKYNWQTVVVKSKKPNAFVMPNGKIVVFTGILPIAKNEAGLAAVIGHEVAHVVARHSAERMSHVLLTQTALSVADATMASNNSKYQPAISAALGLGAQYGVLLPFSRDHETEADHIGLLYMAKAGYDPAEAIGVWERMRMSSGSGPWEYLSTHPSHETRITNMQAWQTEAALFYADRGRSLPSNLTELQNARAIQLSKAASAPTAFAPEVFPGFWYTMFSSTRASDVKYHLEKKASCDQGQCLFLLGNNGTSATMTSDFALVKTENEDRTWNQYSPPLRQIKFPLTVGDSWSDTITIENSSGKKQQLSFKFNVVGYEPISVKAGNFLAYKIVSTVNGIRTREGWYAPETGTFVKTVSADGRGAETVSELVDYQKNISTAGDI